MDRKSVEPGLLKAWNRHKNWPVFIQEEGRFSRDHFYVWGCMRMRRKSTEKVGGAGGGEAGRLMAN